MSYTISTHTCRVNVVALSAEVVLLAHDDADGAHGPARYRWTFRVCPSTSYSIDRKRHALDAGEVAVHGDAERWAPARGEWQSCDLTGHRGGVAREYAGAKRLAAKTGLDALRTAAAAAPLDVVAAAYVGQLRACLVLGDRLRSVDGDLYPGDTPWDGDEVCEQIARGTREDEAREAHARLEALSELAERLGVHVSELRTTERERHRAHVEATRRDKILAESSARDAKEAS